MKTLQLNNGAEMPALGLGTWKSAPGEVHRAIVEAVRLGYRHIDCAWIYGNEAEIGEALTELFEEGVVTRSDLWITSKLWNDRHAPADVEPAFRETLSNLKLDALDLYLLHWPVALRAGALFPETSADLLSLDDVPVAQTWAAMESLVDSGLCRTIGVSNFSVPKLGSLLETVRIKPAVNQIELHPYLQQPRMLEFCQGANVVLTGYSPLGSRDRPDRLRAADDPILLDDETVADIATKHQVTSAQVLIAWALNRGTSVIPKSVNPSRLRQNLAAASIELEAADMARLAALDRHRRYVGGGIWTLEGGPYTQATLWDE